MAKQSNKKKVKVDPEGIGFIKSTFNNTHVTISDKYGSLDNYLEKQLNVSNKDILLLRDKFLEQTN